mmetsp:Transcript_7843/g.15686  ORF Transcript_7843/g.15686 Transcript_7843/m.15686 type:complete len:640 (+) Transcript_7843:47-1966(+)
MKPPSLHISIPQSSEPSSSATSSGGPSSASSRSSSQNSSTLMPPPPSPRFPGLGVGSIRIASTVPETPPSTFTLTFGELHQRSLLNEQVKNLNIKGLQKVMNDIKNEGDTPVCLSIEEGGGSNADDGGGSKPSATSQSSTALTSSSEPPLIVACSLADTPSGLEVLEYLLKHEGRIVGMTSTYDSMGFTGSHWLAAINSVSGLQLWNLAGGKLDGLASNGDTPLHRASILNQSAVIKYLTGLRMGTGIRNGRGEAAVDLCTGDRAAFWTQKECRTLILSHGDCDRHITVEGHQEAPARIPAIMKELRASFKKGELEFSSDFERATMFQIRRAHHSTYVDMVHRMSRDFYAKTPRSQMKIEALTPRVQKDVEGKTKNIKEESTCDTSFSIGSLDAALRAAGGVVHAVDKVCAGEYKNSFVVVRPPGHHAGWKGHVASSTSCGFCIFNSVAVGALHALECVEGIDKVAIIDFDVHHGNGTEEIVRTIGKPGNIFFASAHIYDPNFYPGSGSCDDLECNIVNCGIPPMWECHNKVLEDQFGKAAFRREVVSRIAPSLRAFNPDLVILSMGFDGSKGDIGNKRDANRNGSVGLDLSREDYAWAVGIIRKISDVCCGGRLVSVLEGGYGKTEREKVRRKSGEQG